MGSMKGDDPGKRVLPVFFLMVAGLCFLASCAGVEMGAKSPGGTPTERKTQAPLLFRSEEYAVARLKGGETPLDLAERFLGDRKRSWVIEDANPGVPYKEDQIVAIPLKERNKGGLTAEGYQVVPILCYHDFAENCNSSLCTPKPLFDQQMRYLKENGYSVVSMGELFAFLNYRRSLPKKSVVLTIDDGYRSAYEVAYPILKKYGFRATLFVYTDFIGASGAALTWDQLKEMKKNGIEVGSHTLSHCDLTKREEGEEMETYGARVRQELLLSKETIDKNLAQDTIALAFPYGEYNPRILYLSEKIGYKIGLSVKNGGNPFFADPLTLRREQMLKKDMESFVSKLRTFYEISLK